MILECPVIINNNAVTVVKYGNIDVQFPSVRKDVKTLMVKCDNGKYSLVNHVEEIEPVVKNETRTAEINNKQKKSKKQSEKKLVDVVED